MPMNQNYVQSQPSRSEVDALEGLTLLEFGTDWCGHCRLAQPLISDVLSERPAIRHMKIEDGPRRPLGRSFRIKLWPTLILLREGQELARVVRPTNLDVLEKALEQVSDSSSE